jgi:glycolate oxidase iron-sulfur subunit
VERFYQEKTMADIEALVRLMRELEDQLVVCMRCGMCQAVCPVYAQTGREADVARGKLALLEGLMQEMFDNPRGVSERLNKCLLCGSCAANCPSGVSVLEIFIKARAILSGYMGLSPAKQLVLKGMLAHPHLFDRVLEWSVRFQKIFTKPANEVVGTSCARFLSPLISDRHFKLLADIPFHRRVPRLNSEPARGKPKVAFFIGCLIDKIFPEVAKSAIYVLEHHGAGAFIPDNQGCCGIPALSSGDTDTFKRLLYHNLDKFSGIEFDYLVTACATCTSTIKKIWPVMANEVAGELKDRVAVLAGKTMDISQLLVAKVGLRPAGGEIANPPIVVTYHDPCHLKKSLDVSAEPREVIRAAAGYRLVEMAESDACCGMGGSFNLQYYDISSRIGRLKRDHIQATGCKVVATGCPACMLQIADVLSKAGNKIAVRHPIEIYAEAVRKIKSDAKEPVKKLTCKC